ncbi:hypothetical protein L2E82_37466 [Cichorium intybus]|uniref:Uncharacterized protein n=1 Tax=Cichorium intybus TaxID=13427 RepID=A0ACB9ADJ6_CICIN|nr:hypothetical protein L2E82_37466 [Cichorium intybus]
METKSRGRSGANGDDGGRSGANGDDGGWTKVNRRRRSVRPVNLDGRTTSFFVSNIPDGVNPLELKLICKNIYSGFSSLTDVYLAKKKDVNGHNFAFVRYRDVSNVNEIIESLNMVRCIDKVLIANVARFQRQPAKSLRHPPPPAAHGKFQHYPNPRSSFASRFRDGKSFADVVSGMPNGETEAIRAPMNAKPSAIISLNRNQEDLAWLDQASLVREVKNLETLSHIQSIIEEDGYCDAQTKYLEDWSPFCNSSDYPSDSSDDENIDGDEDDDEGVSDTWVHNDDAYEEGEIKEDNDTPGDHSTTPVDDQTNADASSEFVQSLPNDDQMQVNCADEPNGPNVNPIPHFPIFSPIEPHDPSTNRSNGAGDTVPLTNVNASPLFTPSKRRKLDMRNSRFNPYRRPPSPVDRTNGQGSSSPSIDLNRVIPPPPSHCDRPDANDSSASISSFSKEIEHTIHIGNQLGFGIDEGNEIFREVMCGDGSINPQL